MGFFACSICGRPWESHGTACLEAPQQTAHNEYPYPDCIGTHRHGYYHTPGHHNCAVAEVERLTQLLHRVIDELGDPTYERWCDSPAPDRELLESLLRDLKREVKDGSD